MTRSIHDRPEYLALVDRIQREGFTSEGLRRAATKGSFYVGGVYSIETGRWTGGHWVQGVPTGHPFLARPKVGR